MKPLLMMRTRGLSGPLFAKHANLSSHLSKSSGTYIGLEIVPYENLLGNSNWDGISGSVGGANFVAPIGYTTGFWPPDEATAIVDLTGNKCEFTALAGNRGYLVFALNLPAGTIVNGSVFVDEITTSSNQRPIHMTGDAVELEGSGNNTLSTGRKSGVYEITGPAAQLRVGAGTTSAGEQQMILSRPQITLGASLLPYRPTYAATQVSHQGVPVTFNGYAVTHT